MSSVCKYCGCTDIERDPARGDVVCTRCGTVLEEQNIVSEVQFEDGGGGGRNVIGQFVSSESRSQSLKSARITMEDLACGKLAIKAHQVDQAFKFFEVAFAGHFTRGHKTKNMVASCLYLQCRLDGSSHMLLDFSDELQINVFELAATYNYLIKKLHINPPTVCPTAYVDRFSHTLEIGDKRQEVALTAMRLVNRMKQDWIVVGRRPSGVCGAAMMIACRMHGLNRTVDDIVRICHTSAATVKKRLHEFSETDSGHLTVDEFTRIDLEQEHDPPCLKKSKHTWSSEHAEFEKALDDLRSQNIEEEMKALIDKINEQTSAKLKARFKTYYAQMLTDAIEEETKGEVEDKCELDAKQSEMESFDAVLDRLSAETAAETAADELQVGEDGEEVGTPQREEKTEKVSPQKRLKSSKFDSSDEELNEEDDPLEYAIRKHGLSSLRPDASTIGMNKLFEEKEPGADDNIEEGVESGEDLSLTGLSDDDDEDLGHYVLSDSEAHVREALWRRQNASYLREVAVKKKIEKELEQEALARGEEPPNFDKKPRKSVAAKRKLNVEASRHCKTPAAAVEKVLMKENRISQKINYDRLKDVLVKYTDDVISAKKESQKETLPP